MLQLQFETYAACNISHACFLRATEFPGSDRISLLTKNGRYVWLKRRNFLRKYCRRDRISCDTGNSMNEIIGEIPLARFFIIIFPIEGKTVFHEEWRRVSNRFWMFCRDAPSVRFSVSSRLYLLAAIVAACGKIIL